MSEIQDCQRRFQAAVDVIQSLPKNGSYKPSYQVMLRFYGLYKQAVCGPCTVSRPGFWDPVGRYKWEAWNHLGDMSRETAMAAYVDEMKKVAQEVIDTVQIDEKNASFFHYFEPLYQVIHDMPRPPEALFSLSSEPTGDLAKHEVESTTQEPGSQEDTETIHDIKVQPQSTDQPVSECQGLTSDSESEVFCDSLEQVDTIKNGHARSEISGIQENHYRPLSQVIQIGAGYGCEGAEDKRDPPTKMMTTRREWVQQNWEPPSDDMAHNRSRWIERLASGVGSGRGGENNSEGGPNRLQDGQIQQQIMLSLRQLREDMQSVMERLNVVESLATANAQNSQWMAYFQLTVGETEDKGWPFEISGYTLLLLLVWPFVAQWLSFLLRRRKRKIHGCI